jgi:hypothetical protein
MAQFKGLSKEWADRLISDGFSTPKKIAAAPVSRLSANPVAARNLKALAQALCAGRTP